MNTSDDSEQRPIHGSERVRQLETERRLQDETVSILRAALAESRSERDAAVKDAARYRWLAPRLIAADFDWNDSGKPVLIFDWPPTVGVGGSCDQNVDAAMESATGEPTNSVEFDRIAQVAQGEVTVVTNEAGECVAVTRTDHEHRILSVIWQRAAQPATAAKIEQNQCDGCLRGLPVSGGLHRPDGEWPFGCSAPAAQPEAPAVPNSLESGGIGAPAGWEPAFDAMTSAQEALAIKFCADIAGMHEERGSSLDPVRLLEMAEALYLAERNAVFSPAPTSERSI